MTAVQAPKTSNEGTTTAVAAPTTPAVTPATVETPVQPVTSAPAAEQEKPADAFDFKPQGEKLPEAKTTAAQDWKTEELKTPEGVNSISPDVLAALGEVARTQGISKEGTQAILNSMLPKMKAAEQSFLKTTAETWEKESMKDPEIGGANWQATLDAVRPAYNAAVSPKLDAMLKRAGLHKNVEMLRMFKFFGTRMRQDTFIGGGTPNEKPNPLRQMFAKSPELKA